MKSKSTSSALLGGGRYATNTVTANYPATITFQYDAHGNLTNDGTRTFKYDGENRCTNVLVASLWRTDFRYGKPGEHGSPSGEHWH